MTKSRDSRNFLRRLGIVPTPTRPATTLNLADAGAQRLRLQAVQLDHTLIARQSATVTGDTGISRKWPLDEQRLADE